MTSLSARSPRRSDALSRERIVEAAIDVLDAEGEKALTFRALTSHLSTGAGAIYHHVANKDELLAAATDGVIGQALAGVESTAQPQEAIRALSLGIFDAIDRHPWVGTELSRAPGQPAIVQIWTAIGLQLTTLGLAGAGRADAGAALVNYVLGAAAQYAGGALTLPHATDRKAYLAGLAAQVAQNAPHDDPFALEMASAIEEHDDRAQFLAGVDIFLAGISTVH